MGVSHAWVKRCGHVGQVGVLRLDLKFWLKSVPPGCSNSQQLLCVCELSASDLLFHTRVIIKELKDLKNLIFLYMRLPHCLSKSSCSIQEDVFKLI